jgi:hypothetical protein
MGTAAVELALAVAGFAAPQASGMPAPLWTGVKRLALSCSADPQSAAALGGGWCAEVLAEARKGAAIPIDPSSAAHGGRDTLNVHVAARDSEISVKLERALSLDDAEGGFFRRGPALPTGAASDPEVRAAIAAALDGALPWRRKLAPSGRSRRQPAA